jgi:hypothetical protein
MSVSIPLSVYRRLTPANLAVLIVSEVASKPEKLFSNPKENLESRSAACHQHDPAQADQSVSNGPKIQTWISIKRLHLYVLHMVVPQSVMSPVS